MEFKKRVRLGQNIILKATLANSLDIISITGTIQDGMSRSLAISQSMNKNIASVLGDTGQVIDLFERELLSLIKFYHLLNFRRTRE